MGTKRGGERGRGRCKWDLSKGLIILEKNEKKEFIPIAIFRL
jgi:hypothetical protein